MTATTATTATTAAQPTHHTEYAQGGETLDCIAYRVGSTHSLEAIHAANPQLCYAPAVLPYGTPVLIPFNNTRAEQTPTRATIALWD